MGRSERSRRRAVSTSIGIALSSPAYSDPEEVLRDADAAMYRAKARGRSRHEIFGDDMLADARGLLRLESELRRGLERGEFVVLYQPILSLHSRRTIGAEALVRWMHPQRGLLLPEDFIPVAEETGLISPLGEWVLQQACAQAQRWRRQGLADLTMAVNLSARQFRQGDLPQLILRTIGGSGLAPGALDLELTESTLMENLPDTVRSLEQLKALGVRLSIDDFGTGYSSLSYLKRFPVDTLKIDRSFVENIATDPRDGAITSAVIALGRSLKLSVIAEGVENEAQLAFLRKEGCDALQGFAYSPPLGAQDFEEVARRTFLE